MTDKCNTCTRIKDGQLHPSNVVMTEEQFKQFEIQANKNQHHQAFRFLMMQGIPQTVANEYLKEVTEQKTWKPKIK